ncbi:MAG: NGG1p interacting factor NIF3 [Candidatus Omnitrophota bacterium]
MKLSRFYNQVIKFASDRDPRKRPLIKAYPDSEVLYGRADTEVRKILVGIDIEVAELLLADRIRQKGGLDLVVAHHPEGRAFARLAEVMQVQVDLLTGIGMDRAMAQELLDERMRQVERRILPQNHTRPVDAARLLDLPFICIHTPADNHAFCYVRKLINKKKPRLLQDIIDLLLEEPEYRKAKSNSCGPRIILGSPKRSIGKVLIEMTGGTSGPINVFDKLYKAGVRTLVSMHMGEEHFKKVKDANLNVVIAGHISSDTLGLNLLLDRIEKEETFQTINCSGFSRFKRQ